MMMMITINPFAFCARSRGPCIFALAINTEGNSWSRPALARLKLSFYFCSLLDRFYFQTFLGQKYGYRPFPARIAASEFEKLLGAVDSQDDHQLLKSWFWRDDNAVPAQYLLQPITSLLPHYRDYENSELRKKASADWWAAFERMQVVLRMAADKALTKNSERHKYYMSGMAYHSDISESNKDLVFNSTQCCTK